MPSGGQSCWQTTKQEFASWPGRSSGPTDTLYLKPWTAWKRWKWRNSTPGPIHLLLTDRCLPRPDGGGLIRKLSDRRPETAILVMSGYMDVEAPPKAAVLRKPFHPQDLVNTVNGVLEFSSNGTDRNGRLSPGLKIVHTVAAGRLSAIQSGERRCGHHRNALVHLVLESGHHRIAECPCGRIPKTGAGAIGSPGWRPCHTAEFWCASANSRLYMCR